LDVGQKHIGVAITDVSKCTVSPICDISRKAPRNQIESVDKVAKALQKLIDYHNVVGIVCGFPLSPSGGVTPFCEEIVRLVGLIECMQPQPSAFDTAESVVADNFREPMLCTFWDERNSTVSARRLIQSQMSRRRAVVSKYKDSMAACLILEGFLNRCRDHDDNEQ
jgi:RNase H-fold protein (predicted Holliday junction resolvase)